MDGVGIVGASPPHPVPDQAEPHRPAASPDQAEPRPAASAGSRVQFSMEPELSQVVIKVVNEESGEVIRQIPPEERLEAAKRWEQFVGTRLARRA